MKNPPTYPKSWLNKIDQEAILSTENGLSGAVVSMNIDGNNIFCKQYGFQRKYNQQELMTQPEPMRVETIFDLASLTKIFSTTLAYMMLVDQKKICIEDKVKRYLPDFTNSEVSIKQLLGHNSGLPADYHFFNPKLVPPDFYSQTRSKTVQIAPKVPPVCAPGTKTIYSDINFIILGIILEKITGIRQDTFVESKIYKPLGLKNTGYALLQKGFQIGQFEASERCGNTRDGRISFPNIRTKTIQGEVQDETAYYAMEQIAGNAGLFSTAADLEILCQLLLNKGRYKSYKLCSDATAELFFQTNNIDNSYTLGFQIPSNQTALIYGMLLPAGGNAFGHTGWTGKCFIIDFQHNSSAIILNNKRHSPVINVNDKALKFEGNLLPTSIYGGTMQLFYAGLIDS